MSFAREAMQSLRSAIGILRHEPSALDGFNLSIEGFWRSFSVIVALLPAAWVTVLSGEKLTLSNSQAETPPTFAQGSLLLLVLLVLWPVVAAGLARFFGLGGHYLRYVIAYNWLSLPLTALMLIPNLLYLGGIIGPGLLAVFGVVTYVIALFYSWYIARIAFETTGVIAFAFLVADLALTIGLSYLVEL
jgi:hypothetical protein